MLDQDTYKKLRTPFTVKFINWKINNYNDAKTKAMITFYLDARAVQHRLNEVLGVGGWSFSWTELEKDKGVHGKLTMYILSNDLSNAKNKDECVLQEVTREDVGYANNTDKAEWYKDAVSDALKRCAVHFGVGHFLYALPNYWIDLEQQGQKYLSQEQNENISVWLRQQIDKMRVNKTAEPVDKTSNK